MNKLSKLTALLLAIVLALGVPMQVMAEGEEIETKTKYYEVADKILQAMIMNYQTYGEYKSMAEIIANEDFAAFLDGLPEEELKELANYVNDMFWAACIPYTNVGPFMPAVDVTNQLETASTFSLISRAATDEETVEGLYLDKTATGPDANGQYTITLEAYVTGQVTTSTVNTFTPVDVVLVLDTSGSMAYDVSSDDTTVDYEDSRRYALQQGVNTFIDQVAEQSINANHRISIVEYDRTNHSVLADWSFVDTQARVDALKDAVDTLDAEGGTRPGMGLDHAYDQLTDDYNAPQGSTERKKIVVLFTDGIPSRTSFQPDFAAEAIETAYLLKANPDTVTGGVGATLYSIAIFPGANPATPVSTWTDIYTGTDDIAICNAFLHAVSSNYPSARASEGTVTVGPWWNQSEYDCVDITPGTGGNNGYYLTANSVESMKEIFTKISDNIQSSTTTSTLTETTVVKDVLSPYFELPFVYVTDANGNPVYETDEDGNYVLDANGNKIQKRDYANAKITITEYDHTGDTTDGTPTWTKLDTTTATYEIVGENTLHVTNFDFQENAVVTVTNNNVPDYQGKKLVITFVVEPTDGFLGGNNVVTNDPSSGIYQPSTDEEGNTTLEPVKPFPEPDVDVDVPPLKIVGENQHIYLGNNASLDALLQSFSVYYDIVDDSGNFVSGRYQVDSILNHYTSLDFTLKIDVDKDGTIEDNEVFATYHIDVASKDGKWTYNNNVSDTLNWAFDTDTQFDISYIAKSPAATNDDGTTDPEQTSDGSLTAWVYVYKPEVTFQDSVEKYMDTMDEADADAYYAANNVPTENVVWKHDTQGTAGEQMSGTEPKLTYVYTTDETWLNTSKQVTATKDVNVTVQTTVTGTGYPDGHVLRAEQITYYRNRVAGCPDTCTWTSGDESKNNPAFVIHITDVMSSLTITKVCGTPANAEDTFIFTITGTDDNTNSVNMRVVLKAGESVTINNLLIGGYKVTEDLSWSWRYTLNSVEGQNGTPVASVTKDSTLIGATLSVDADGAGVTFTNSVTEHQWLDGSAYAENVFTNSGATRVD